MPPSLPPIPARPDNRECRWHGSPFPRVAFPLGYASPLLPQGMMICAVCDMAGGSADAGPPVLLDYIRKGHR
jgi:hypothetical protein